MQVKKFEAKTMKDALEMVKSTLGPEAIILSAKDSHRGFGLMGERSVEVTAAVSEETLRKKKFAETKLRDELRERFQAIPAAQQREFINRASRPRAAAPAAPARASQAGLGLIAPPAAATRRYIDIDDEEAHEAPVAVRSRAAAAAAYRPSASTAPAVRAPAPVLVAAPVASAMPVPAPTGQVAALENQVRELRTLIERMQGLTNQPTTLHPGADYALPFEVSGLFQRLTEQGVGAPVVAKALRTAAEQLGPESLKKPALIDAWMVRHLLDTTRVALNPTAGRYHVFAGTTAQGKTTTLVKFASHLIMKERRTIAIISLDTIKLGAADQLRLYAQILNVPFAIVRNAEEWKVAEQKLGHVQHVLVDCPGFSLNDPRELEWLRQMLPPAGVDRRTHFVQSILARDEEIQDIAARYQAIGFDDVIFTRLDESGRQGSIVNFQDRFRVPLHSFAYGTRIPEDYEFASASRVVDLLFKLSKASNGDRA